MITSRPGWTAWALGVAAALSARGDCRRSQVGALILDDHHRIIGSGYNGSEPGGPSCLAGECPRAFTDVEHGSSYDSGPGACIALHAEQNAIMDAGVRNCRGAVMYVTRQPCDGCLRMIKGAGIVRVVAMDNQPELR